MVSVRRPNHRGNKPQKSLLTLRNILVAIAALGLANILVRTLFPKRAHQLDAVVRQGEKTLHDVWNEQQQQLRGQAQDKLEPHGVKVEPGHPKEHDSNKAQQHSDADDHVEKQPVTTNKDQPKQPAADAKLVDEIQIRQDKAVPETSKIAVKEKADQPESPLSAHQVVLTKLGSGPTAHGYVVDLVEDRSHPEFRSQSIPSDHYSKLVQTVASVHGSKVEACEYLEAGRLRQRDTCRDADTSLIAYNSADFTRYLCGQAILPNQAVVLSGEPCREPAHLFPQELVPILGHGMPPVQVVKSLTASPPTNLETIDCDIPCQYEPNLPADQYIAGTKWNLKVSDKDPLGDMAARIEKSAFRQDVYYSTTSLKSSIPLSYYNASAHSIRNRPALDWASAAHKASFFLDKDCYQGNSRRMKWFTAIGTQIATEAYGSCGHTTDLKDGQSIATLEGRLALAKQNRIHLAFEESTEKDFVTDIVWESLLSGAVPAVLGSANIAQYVPPNSIIDASLFNSWDKYAEHLKNVSENQTLWESYHAWRSNEDAIRAFEVRMNFTHTSPQCRTCRWAYAKLYGLGWDHYQQVVRDTALPRRLCIDEVAGMASRPFRESWGSASPPEAGTGNCQSLTAETTIGNLKRTLIQHDGVVDMELSSTSDAAATDDVVLRMRTTLRNSEGAYFPHPHSLVPTIRGSLYSSGTIQDESSRVTVLANWDTTIRSPEEGVIEIVVQMKGQSLATGEVKRLRIITEDTHPVHDKMTEFYPSSFCKRMVKDFVDPIDLFSAQV